MAQWLNEGCGDQNIREFFEKVHTLMGHQVIQEPFQAPKWKAVQFSHGAHRKTALYKLWVSPVLSPKFILILTLYLLLQGSQFEYLFYQNDILPFWGFYVPHSWRLTKTVTTNQQ